jgi:hypothetical protein
VNRLSFMKSDDDASSEGATGADEHREVEEPCWQCPGAEPSIPPTRHLCQHGEV